MLLEKSDEYFMKKALEQAEIALEKGELPVGAVIVFNNQIIARAHNQTQQLNDFTAHAEMIAFTAASEYFANKYLDKCTLYVTLEPCIMCGGASYWTRIGKIVYGASDTKKGFTKINPTILLDKQEVVSGVLNIASEKLLEDFFANRRNK